MTGEQFKAWMAKMGLNKLEASRVLAISRTSVDKYLEEGPPKSIGLACAAIAMGLPEWGDVTRI